MLTRNDSFTVVSLTLGVIGLVLTIGTIIFSFSGFSQSSVNTDALNAQIAAQRILLQASLSPLLAAAPGGAGVGVPAAHAEATRQALAALQAYKLPGDE